MVLKTSCISRGPAAEASGATKTGMLTAHRRKIPCRRTTLPCTRPCLTSPYKTWYESDCEATCRGASLLLPKNSVPANQSTLLTCKHYRETFPVACNDALPLPFVRLAMAQRRTAHWLQRIPELSVLFVGSQPADIPGSIVKGCLLHDTIVSDTQIVGFGSAGRQHQLQHLAVIARCPCRPRPRSWQCLPRVI